LLENQQPQIEQKHKINTRIINSEHSPVEFLPVRRCKLPYNMPD
jgi:hypothetical protein